LHHWYGLAAWGFLPCSVFGIDLFYLLATRFEQAGDLPAFCLSETTQNRRLLVSSIPLHFTTASMSRLKSPAGGPDATDIESAASWLGCFQWRA
jgi:hypothetical protein